MIQSKCLNRYMPTKQGRSQEGLQTYEQEEALQEQERRVDAFSFKAGRVVVLSKDLAHTLQAARRALERVHRHNGDGYV